MLPHTAIWIADISVETFKCSVQQGGFVNFQAAANKAVELANGVRGLKSIKSDMLIK